ncbi:TorF family putative porin [Tahibacter soli]|uniref:TorF family putative porin n=1 Tax=Tahibacter soli TaxID=2983605 RepID=A0A9X3YPS0_9GAMM|nr:TorF family putative porin [Tahibacter soli]MDC8014476.1 TorF family putative porin [Tahibacter soli]
MAGNTHRSRRCGLGFALVLATSGTAAAQGFGGALGYGNDNVYRGVSLTQGSSAWLADLHYDFGNGWVAGVGASSERPRFQEAGAQFQWYADRRWQIDDDWSAKVGVVHYDSPSNFWRKELDYNDLTAAIGWRGRWRLSVALSPDTPGVFRYPDKTRIGYAATVELGYTQPLVDRLSLNAGLGYYDLHEVADLGYAYGSIGLSYGIGDFNVYTSAIWADADARRYYMGSETRTRWVTTVVWSF